MPASLGAVMEGLGGRPEQLNLILGMIAMGELVIDLDAALRMDAALWPGSRHE